MAIDQLQHDDIEIVVLSGQLIIKSSPELSEFLKSFLQDGASKLSFDLHKALFIDSSGSSVIFLAFKGMQAMSGRLVLVTTAVQQQPLREITDTHTIFQISPTFSVALASLETIRNI